MLTTADVRQPHFYQTVSASQILAQLAAINPDKVSAATVFQAKQEEGKKKAITGVTFFPPNTCDPRVVAPPPSRAHLMQAAAVAPVMPAYFCWADSNNVADVKGWGKRPASMGPYTSPVFNQHTCGSCWAVASAGVFSDRWAIYTQGPNPQLSPTDILGCVNQGATRSATVNFDACDGCNGGLPAGAAKLFAAKGIVTGKCLPYNWCNRDSVCSGQEASVGGGGDMLNRLIPMCQSVECTDPQRFKAKYYTNTAQPKLAQLSMETVKTTVGANGMFQLRQINPNTSAALSITGVQDIQREILANGPVVGAMAIFYDFQAGTLPGSGDWAPTKNVYCNVQGPGRKPYAGTRYANTESQLQGYHAVAVVGWGLERGVDDWNNPGQTFDLPYWIVRNSWGQQWNTKCTVGNGLVLPGFFKIAWSDPMRNINTQVVLDMTRNGEIGGMTAFEPDVFPRADPPGKKTVNAKVSGFYFDGTTCKSAPDQQSVQYQTLEECQLTHPGQTPQTAVSFDCKFLKKQCVPKYDGSGKYADENECNSTCATQYNVAVAVIVVTSVLVALAIGLGVGLGVTRAKRQPAV